MKKVDDTFSKADTVALWHAVQWMATVVQEMRRERFQDERERAQYDAERARLTAAKRALRKANTIRKSQAQAAEMRNFANCMPSAERQAEQKTAGGNGP